MAKTESTHDAATAEHHGGHGPETVDEPLGPVDMMAWLYAVAGSLLGVLVVLALTIARGG